MFLPLSLSHDRPKQIPYAPCRLTWLCDDLHNLVLGLLCQQSLHTNVSNLEQYSQSAGSAGLLSLVMPQTHQDVILRMTVLCGPRHSV